MPTGDAYSSGHLVESLWDLHMFYFLRPILFQTCRHFSELCSSNIPRYFLDFAFKWHISCFHFMRFICPNLVVNFAFYSDSVCLSSLCFNLRRIPLSLRWKTRQRAIPLLPTWIYSCRSRVTVSCALPCTTIVTISTSTSQTFRSWVAIFHLRQPMVFLSHSSYGMPGLAPLMNILF